MIDIHTHIIPGVDDGAESLEESLAMAELAWESGVDTIVATPHANIPGSFRNFYSPRWRENFQKLQHFLAEQGCKIQLVPGMEIFATDHVSEKIQSGEVCPIQDSRYYLMEIPFDADPYWAEEIWESVLRIHKVPVIAHPERYFCIQDEPAILYEWMKMGCLSQMNKGSVFGRFGTRAQRTAEVLLDHNLITCAASDAHSPYRRTTFMADIEDYLLDLYGERRMERLLISNPDRMIHDQTIYSENMSRPGRRQGLFPW